MVTEFVAMFMVSGRLARTFFVAPLAVNNGQTDLFSSRGSAVWSHDQPSAVRWKLKNPAVPKRNAARSS